MPEDLKKIRPGTAILQPQVKLDRRTFADPKLERRQLRKLTNTSVEGWEKVVAGLSREFAHRALKSKFWEKDEEIVLSARTPVHEKRGWLEGNQIQSYFPVQPVMWFKWQSGKLYIWLENLDTAGTYMMEIRCSAYNGELRVGASDAPHAMMPAQGQDHRIWVVIDEPDYDLSLVTLDGDKVDNWCFYDARVWRIE